MNGLPDSSLFVLRGPLSFVGRLEDLLSFLLRSKEAAEPYGERNQQHAKFHTFIDDRKDKSLAKRETRPETVLAVN